MRNLASIVLFLLFTATSGCAMNDSAFTKDCLKHNAGLMGCVNNSNTTNFKSLEAESFHTGDEYATYRRLVVDDKELQSTVKSYTKYCSATHEITDLAMLDRVKIYEHIVRLNKQIKEGKRVQHELAICALMHAYTFRQ